MMANTKVVESTTERDYGKEQIRRIHVWQVRDREEITGVDGEELPLSGLDWAT